MKEEREIQSPLAGEKNLESTLGDRQMNMTSEQSTDDQPNGVQSKQMLPFSQQNILRLKQKQNLGIGQKLIEDVNSLKDLITNNGELILKNQKMTIVPHIFQQAQSENLLVLDIRYNDISEIDETLCKSLCRLKKLDARNNKLKALSREVKSLKHLQILRLDHNDLKYMPDEVYELTNLEELSFSDNEVTGLVKQIGQLEKLKIFNMADNCIQQIPQELGNLSQLKSLFIHGNKFTSLPCSLMNLSNLQEMSLEWFLYVRPPLPKIVKRYLSNGNKSSDSNKMHESTKIFESLITLFGILQKYNMQECAFITFFDNFSKDNVDINHVDNRLRTPLHHSVVKGDNGVLAGLLLGKVDPNKLDKDNCTPLCLAIREENYDGASLLINSNVDVNLGGGIYGSPMHLAVVKLEIWIIRSLIMKQADVNKVDCDGNTPLHQVMNVFSKNPKKCAYITEILVFNGAKVNIKNNDNWSPLHLAVRKCQEKGVETIIKLNEQLAAKEMEQFDLNLTGGVQQWTPLHLAAHGNHLSIVKHLLANNADIFIRNQNNQLPRHCAKGNYMLTKFLKQAEQKKTKEIMTQGGGQLIHESDLIAGVQMKEYQWKKGQKINLDSAMKDYDQFLSNLTSTKIRKTVNQIKIGNQQPLMQQLENQSNYSSSFSGVRASFEAKQLEKTMEGKDSKFRQLNIKAEEKKINLFYLKDLLIKDGCTYEEKVDALFKIKKNVNKQVFALAMKSLLKDYEKIKDDFFKKEIIYTIGCSPHFILIEPLQEVLKNQDLMPDFEEDIEEAILCLKIVKEKPNVVKKNIKVTSISRPNHLQSFNAKHTMAECDLILEDIDNNFLTKTQANLGKTQQLNTSDLKLFTQAKRAMGS